MPYSFRTLLFSHPQRWYWREPPLYLLMWKRMRSIYLYNLTWNKKFSVSKQEGKLYTQSDYCSRFVWVSELSGNKRDCRKIWIGDFDDAQVIWWIYRWQTGLQFRRYIYHLFFPCKTVGVLWRWWCDFYEQRPMGCTYTVIQGTWQRKFQI